MRNSAQSHPDSLPIGGAGGIQGQIYRQWRLRVKIIIEGRFGAQQQGGWRLQASPAPFQRDDGTIDFKQGEVTHGCVHREGCHGPTLDALRSGIKQGCGTRWNSGKTLVMLSLAPVSRRGCSGWRALSLVILLALAACAGTHSRPSSGVRSGYFETPTTLTCVPYARAVSGIDLHGDADRWWWEAAGLYPRGHDPRIGAVLVLKPHGSMRVGHVAVVTSIRSNREILVTQANWLPGRIEHGVPVMDVSRRNNWSDVRVWYAPINGWGETVYPAYGFILPN